MLPEEVCELKSDHVVDMRSVHGLHSPMDIAVKV